jgi:hypothetical protein
VAPDKWIERFWRTEKTMKRVQLLLAAALLAPLPALAQASRVYEASAMIPTGIEAVRTFPEPRAGFDAVRASDIDLARYGLPPRPHDLESLARWQEAMSTGARRSHQPIRKMPFAAEPHRPTARSGAKPFQTASQNWSGAVDFIPYPTYDPAHSFSQVTAQFTVPFAQSAFAAGGGNVCAGGTAAVGWIGFDGYGTNEVLQGGWYAWEGCGGGEQQPSDYCLWGEWWPNTAVLCQLPAAPGDVAFVEVWNTSSTQGYVYVQDLTTNVYQTVALTCTIRCLFANSVEYIIERPDTQPIPLMNYVRAFIIGGSAETFDKYIYTASDVTKRPGAIPASYHVVMQEPDSIGTLEIVSDYQLSGRWDLVFSNAGCSLSGGCSAP